MENICEQLSRMAAKLFLEDAICYHELRELLLSARDEIELLERENDHLTKELQDA